MKRSDISDPGKWSFYEAILDDVRFEWPDPFDCGLYHAKIDCMIYLDKIFDKKYKLRTFERKES